MVRATSTPHSATILPLAALIVVALLSGCATPGPQATPPSRADFPAVPTARIGQTIRVDGPAVTPLALLEDSRCPRGVACVWAGRLRISVRITTGAGAQLRELTLGQPIQVADGALTLVSALPEKNATAGVPVRRYRFGFSFAGGF